MARQSEWVLANLVKPIGASWISLVFMCYQQTEVSTEIPCDLPNTSSPNPSGSDIGRVIDYAHQLGLRVMLEPGVDTVQKGPQAGTGTYSIGRGFSQSQWRQWFESYTAMIVQYAELAEIHHADAFAVGAELRATTHRADDWRAAISAVREVYHGPVTYNANQQADEYMITWWDALDFIGIDAYYTLSRSTSPSVADLVAAWAPVLDRLERLSTSVGRPVVFTEIGYASFLGAADEPWRFCGPEVDLDIQATLYRALFEAIKGREWLKGVFLYVYDTNLSQGGPMDRSHTYSGKPAEDVIRHYFGAPPPDTPTVTPPFPLDTGEQAAVFTLFDDTLAYRGFVDSYGAPADLNYTADVHSGSSAIRVTLPLWGFLGLDLEMDMSRYTWLEFYIKVGDRHPEVMAVATELWRSPTYAYAYGSLLFSGPPYLDGGEFQPGKWQRVRIPLADLHVTGQRITGIGFHDHSCPMKGGPQSAYIATQADYDPILIDDVRLVGESPLPSP